jgi:hypothetical protein
LDVPPEEIAAATAAATEDAAFGTALTTALTTSDTIVSAPAVLAAEPSFGIDAITVFVTKVVISAAEDGWLVAIEATKDCNAASSPFAAAEGDAAKPPAATIDWIT